MRPSHDDPDFPESSWWSQLVNWSLQPRILVTVALAGLFVVIIPAIPVIWPSVGQRTKFQMSLERIDLATSAAKTRATPDHVVHQVTTRWKPHEIVQQVATKHPEWKDRSLLESTLVADLAQAFSQYPWIASVDRVEKTRQGRIIIEVTYRTPAAVVETHRGFSVVDAAGNLLPNDLLTEDYDHLPHLQGIQSLPNGAVGTPWGDALVVAGAKLCAALMPQGTIDSHWSRYGIEAVVAPPPARENAALEPVPPVFDLLTKGNHRVKWGSAPGDDSLEPTVEQKLKRLDLYIQQNGSLDLPADSLGIDIRDFESIKRLTKDNDAYQVIR